MIRGSLIQFHRKYRIDCVESVANIAVVGAESGEDSCHDG